MTDIFKTLFGIDGGDALNQTGQNSNQNEGPFDQWRDWLSFRRMLTPILIKILFWINIAICVFAGLGNIIMSFDSYRGGEQFFMGLMILILGPLFIRVACELLIVIFKMNESLSEISSKLDQEGPDGDSW